jgi:hypothetical protein
VIYITISKINTFPEQSLSKYPPSELSGTDYTPRLCFTSRISMVTASDADADADADADEIPL